jgi:hypothetical protein
MNWIHLREGGGDGEEGVMVYLVMKVAVPSSCTKSCHWKEYIQLLV